MRLSLIVATVVRVSEVSAFLSSVAAQGDSDVEVIIVDQNADSRLIGVVESFATRLSIIHVRSPKGLARARNVGLQYATGQIIAFPDDDCCYPVGLLKKLTDFFMKNPQCLGLTGICVDETGTPSVGRWDKKSGPITRHNVWRRGVSVTIFLRRELVVAVGLFDETLGAGAGTRWGSGEETDYLVRAIDGGHRIWFNPALVVEHPQVRLDDSVTSRRKAWRYAMGMGRVLGKHQFPLMVVLYYWVRPVGGALLALLTGRGKRALYFLAVLRGRVAGWLTADQKSNEDGEGTYV